VSNPIARSCRRRNSSYKAGRLDVRRRRSSNLQIAFTTVFNVAMSDRFQTSQHVEFLSLDRSHFLFNEETQELYALNPVAAYIWSCLDDGLDLSETAELVSGDLEISGSDADTHVRQMVRQWAERRMLLKDGMASADTPELIRPDPQIRLIGEPYERPPDLHFHATRNFQLLAQSLDVRFVSAEAEGRVMETLCHLHRTVGEEPTAIIDVIEERSGFFIVIGSTCLEECQSLDEVAPALKAVMTTLTVASEPYALAFHAAAVSNGVGCLLLPARSGSGKSTLTAALLHSGFHYLSDDVVFLDQPSHRVRGCPFPIGIKESGVAALTSRYPELDRRSVHLRADDARVRYLIPPSATWTLEAANETHETKWIVFPQYNPDRETSLTPIDGGEALTRLLPLSVAGRFLKKENVSALANWINELECYELSVASLSSAIGALQSLDQISPDPPGRM